MTVAPTFLYPTKTRLALLADIEAGHIRLNHFGSGEEARTVDVRDGRLVAVKAWELEGAGWVEPANGTGEPWTLTPYGRAIREVRILDFGAEATPQMVAEVGDPDKPRVLGHVVHVHVAGAGRYEVVIGAISSLVRARPAAWGELWHRACIAYAAQAPISDTASGLPIEAATS